MMQEAILIRRLIRAAFKSVSRRFKSTKLSPSANFDKSLLLKYMSLPVPGNTTLADYIWIDGSGSNLRCRTKTLDIRPVCVEELPQWSVDGSKTKQQPNDDIRLMPVAMYNDPIRRNGAKLVLCETYTMDFKPTPTNTRTACCQTFADAKANKPLFGFCQQYMLMQMNGVPLGWPGQGLELPETAGFYCGVGAKNSIGREIAEAHARACLYAGVGLSGFNSENMASKWRFQIRQTKGIKAPDDVILSRYLLQRIAGEFGVDASFHPKVHPKKGGSGLHVRFTTSFMAEQGGIDEIKQAAKALSKKHKAHMRVYDPKRGKYNKRRLGKNFEKFTWGKKGRMVSVHIPADVEKAGCGYLEDRRPAANCDPYAVCAAILRTTLCGED